MVPRERPSLPGLTQTLRRNGLYLPSQERVPIVQGYVDPSPSASAELFARLKSFFGQGSTSVTGIGDEAYLDAQHGLHVRKGKVRFFISAKAANDKQLRDLATGVAGQL